MNVNEIMTKDVGTCSADSDLESVAKIMWDKDCGSIPVLDNSNKLVGVITDRDIAMGCALNHKAEWEMKTSDILNHRALFTCRSDADVRDALQLMSDHHIRRLPVVDGNGQLQGVLSIDDVVCIAQEDNPELSFRDTMNTLKQVCTHH
ncbi:MAG: CBS domain-containing protein [Gammaproteobacteria bacterium]|jgi:CBS domain-containing protein